MIAIKGDTGHTSKKDSNQAGQDGLSDRAAALRLPLLSEKVKIAKEALEVISKDVARKYRVIAFEKNYKTVKVAMTDPENIEALNVLRFVSQNKNIEVELY